MRINSYILKNKGKKRKLNIVLILVALLVIAGITAALILTAGKQEKVEIKNISIEQKGLNIEVRWDPVECDKYEIKVKKGLFDTQTRKIESSGFRIRNIEIEKKYNIEIRAIRENGDVIGPGYTAIETEKLKQEITTETESVKGFGGDSVTLNAEGKGELKYSSKNRKIATVDERGRITLKKGGKTVITVRAGGNETYKRGRKKIEVLVYPEEMPQVTGLKVENISDSRAVISWEKSDFATGYILAKKNAATGEYEDIMTLEGDETSAEITRNEGSYGVKTVATAGEKTARSKVSEAVEVKGTAREAETYSSGKNIMKLDESNMTLFREIHGDGGTNIPQSMSLAGDCYVISYVNRSGSAGKLISYKRDDGECVDITVCSGMGHANGATYDPNKNRFYIAKTHKSIRTASCSTYDGTTKASAGTFNLPRVTSGIAYDVSNNKYYLSKGNEIYVCDSDFKVEKFIHKFVRYNHAQDIGAYNGVALVCTWVSGSTSYIDMYRTSDGAYLGSYDVSIGEIESCVVDDGYLVILMNTLGSSRDRIYKTKERISIP